MRNRNKKLKDDWEPDDIVGYEGREDCETYSIQYDEIRHVTERGALLVIDGEEEWVPCSQIVCADDECFDATIWWVKKAGYA